MCGDGLHNAAMVPSILILVEQVDSRFFDSRGRMITLDGAPMTIEDALARLFPTLLGIHPTSPVPGFQPDISFFLQRNNVPRNYKILDCGHI